MSKATTKSTNVIRFWAAMTLGAFCATAAYADGFKRKNKSYKSIGTIQAQLDKKEVNWMVIDGHLVSALPASALWEEESFVMPNQEQILEQLQEAMGSGELSAQDKEKLELISNMFSEAGTSIEAFGAMGMEELGGAFNAISIDIDGFDPNEKDPFDSGRLVINTTLSSQLDLGDLPLDATDVDIYYVLSGGNTLFLPDTAYWGVDDANFDSPKVTFTEVDLNNDGPGRVKGEFSATLCHWEKEKLTQGPDKNNCIPIKGQFDTAIYAMPES